MKKVERVESVGDVAKQTIGLNTGAVIRAPGSTSKYKTGSWRVFRPVIDQKKCIKCSTCWRVCPDAAIFVGKGENYRVNYDYCKGCLICARECPADAISKALEEK
jgi:pyruvate ferredoxin oxidoreductase delta subunit